MPHRLGQAEEILADIQGDGAAESTGEEVAMARHDVSADHAAFAAGTGAEVFFRMGLMHASGRAVPQDLVVAHKWLNIAALKGSAEAARLRREIAGEMSRTQIAEAQRQAREWLGLH